MAAVLEELPSSVLLNNRGSTYVWGSRLDMTLVSCDLAPGTSWWAHPTMTSDNYTVSTTLRVGLLPLLLPPHKLNVKAVDWTQFQDILD